MKLSNNTLWPEPRTEEGYKARHASRGTLDLAERMYLASVSDAYNHLCNMDVGELIQWHNYKAKATK